MRSFIVLFSAVIAIVAAAWWQLGQPQEIALTSDPGRIQCVSYAPFAADQSPLDENVHVDARQIERDLTKLAKLTDCVRTYSSAQGIDQVPPIAARLGIKVIQGLWLGRDREKNRAEIDRTVALAKRYHEAIAAIVVGNEVLLRGELAADDIAAILREVKAATQLPVTYADVWEFWLRNRDIVHDVDFVTVHILPYWEDFPIAAAAAGAHVDAIRSEVAAAFPGKDILIGEVGWPSAGRMREGALPSPSNQARVLEEVMARARARNYRVNLIEAFDQPWKRQLEGTVGGYWGLLTATTREPKFAWGAPVSDHPWWHWQLLGGIALIAGIFAGAVAGRRRKRGKLSTKPTDLILRSASETRVSKDGGWLRSRVGLATWPSFEAARAPAEHRASSGRGRQEAAVAASSGGALPDDTNDLSLGKAVLGAISVSAIVAGICAPWAVENALIESLGPGGWICGAAFIVLAFGAPVIAMAALARGIAIPSFASTLGRQQAGPHGVLAMASGLALVATTVLAIQSALGLVFDPRYRDFAFAPFTAAVMPFAVASFVGTRGARPRGTAETVAATTLAASAVYIVLNEGFANWQALWLSALLALLAVTLFRQRDVQST